MPLLLFFNNIIFFSVSGQHHHHQQQHEYDYIMGAYNQARKTSSAHNALVASNPTYVGGPIFSNKHVTNEDTVYEVMYPASSETNTHTNRIAKSKLVAMNPVYDGEYFSNKSTADENADYEVMLPQSGQNDTDDSNVVKIQPIRK